MGSKIRMAFVLCTVLLGFSQLGRAQTELINDGGFEIGIPNPQWNEFSTNFGTPLCTAGMCGYGTGTGPHAGGIWAWFGGTSVVEIGSIDQTIVIPPWGVTTLSFWVENHVSSGSGNDYLQVQIDDVPVLTILEGNPAYYYYSKVSLDISSYADGNAHKIEFYSVCYGTGITNFFVDDVSVLAPPPVPIPWPIIVLVFLVIGAFIVYRFARSKSLIFNK
jgi:hypothetical protein